MEKSNYSNLISVIVPVYNVQEYLDVCLKSIVEQTYENLEIIIINDGSTDTSKEICYKYQRIDPRIVIINQKNSGLSAARNVGFKAAKGEYISFIDSDDFIYPDMYEIMMKYMEDLQADIVECQYETVHKDKELPIQNGKISYNIMDGKEALSCQIMHTKKERITYAVWSRLYRREMIEGIFFPEGMIHEDYFYNAQSFLRAKKFVIIDKCLYCHRIRPLSITQLPFSTRDYDKLCLIKQRTNYLKQEGYDKLASQSERELYLELLVCYFRASNSKNGEESRNIASQLKAYKKAILSHDCMGKYRLDFQLFFISPRLYVAYRKIKGFLYVVVNGR